MSLSRRQLRKSAEALAKDGLGRQQIFSALRMQVGEKDDEKLARIVRYVPSLAARRRYKMPHAVLLVLLWLTVVGKSLYGINVAMDSGWSRWYAALTLPAITVILSVAVAMYRTRAYHTIAFLSVIGLFRYFTHVDMDHFDPWDSVDLIVAAAVIGLSWYLFMKMASNYEVIKTADGGTAILFPSDPQTGTT
ncbi:MAG: hypothetical protein IPP83_05940 [Flavobacteriales bacterium]|nr:hypothetical protein [Flavobacteriales bacterium]